MEVSRVMLFKDGRSVLNCNRDFTSLLAVKSDAIGNLINLYCHGGCILPHPALRVRD